MRRPFPGIVSLPKGLVACLALSVSLCLSGCLGGESEDRSVLEIRNPGIVDGLDSLQVFGINAEGGDTVFIYGWKRGDSVLREIAVPSGMEPAFTLLVRGFQGKVQSYESRSEVAGGRAGSPKLSFKILAPELERLPIPYTVRIGTKVALSPTWKTRPGLFPSDAPADPAIRQAAAAVLTWRKDGKILGKDSLFELEQVTFADSGLYVVTAENSAGRDSGSCLVRVKFGLPFLDSIPDQLAQEKKPFHLRAVVKHTDAVLYRWMKGSTVVSEDSTLTVSGPLAPGAYRLIVKNVSDTADLAVSNAFLLRHFQTASLWDELEWNDNVWQ